MDIRVIASAKNRIEGTALEQLRKIAMLPGVVEAVAMPDLHPGKDAPIGAVFATENVIYPHLVGTDIGCGISLTKLQLSAGKISADKIDRRLACDLEGKWPGDAAEYLQQEGISERTRFDQTSLGTIGQGNHFAEVSRVCRVFDEARFAELKLEKKSLYLLVHSGSRGFGESILNAHARHHGAGGLSIRSEAAQKYLRAHNHALAWACVNRKLIAHRFMEALRTTGRQIAETSHNNVLPFSVAEDRQLWLHRKGAAPTDAGPVLIAGSRGTPSYLVEAAGDQRGNLATVAHGAGRKWRRGECRARLQDRFSVSDLLKTESGGKVICDDKALLYEEAPAAYKDIERVIEDLLEAGIIRTIASFIPIVTYKKRKSER